MDRSNSQIHIEGRSDTTPGEVGSRASAVMAGPGLFETLGIPLRRGRFLDATDRADTSHGVAQRTNEIGVRMAMGAKGREVAGMVLRQGMGPAVAGVLIGLAVSLGAARFLGGFLFNVRTTDPGTYTAVAIIMVAVGLLASYLPARPASKVDPIDALRYE